MADRGGGLREEGQGAGPEPEPVALSRYLKDCGYCLVCEAVRPSIRAHKSTTKRKGQTHNYRGLTAVERQSAKDAWLARAASGAAAVEEQTQKERERLQRIATESSAPPLAGEPEEYRMEFGMYKGKTLKSVRDAIAKKSGEGSGAAKFKEYLQVLITMGWHERKPGFQVALQEAGLWQEVAARAPDTQRALAVRAIQRHEESSGQDHEHREVKLLRRLNADHAVAVLDELGEAGPIVGEPIEEETAGPPRKKRKTRSKARVEIHHCFYCGGADHNAKGCPKRPDLPARRARRRGIAFVSNMRLAQVVSRLKYTPVRQRSKEYDGRPRQMSRAPMRTSFLRLARAPPALLGWMCVQDGLLCDLEGQPCPNPRCAEASHRGFGEAAKLGPRVICKQKGFANWQDVSVHTVFHRCGNCRVRVRLNHGSRLFGNTGGGNKGVSYMTMAFWNCVVGISLSHTCQQLDLNEKTVGEWYRLARRIMAADALERQSKIRFGRRGTTTTVIEADETQLFHWSEEVSEQGVSFRRHWWYVWLGVIERGDLTKLYLTPVGLTKSDGEKGAVPPLPMECWQRVCDELFDASTNAILCTDSCLTYKNYDPPSGAFVQKFQVNHSEHEYTRSEEMIVDVETKKKVVQLAGTQTLDHEWSLLKAFLPRSSSCKTQDGRQVMDEYWRAAQWRRMVNTTDLWTAFCRAAQGHAQQQIGEHLLSPRVQELETKDIEECTREAVAIQDDRRDSAEDLLDMVKTLKVGELERLEQAIAARRAEAATSQIPIGSGPPAAGDQCPLCTDNFTCAIHAARGTRNIDDASRSLGEAAPGVPASVHSAMEKLMREGGIPCTSLEQRLRCGPKAGSGYGVPPGLQEAFQHGYIHPNLPPPLGAKWVCHASVWRLLPQGG